MLRRLKQTVLALMAVLIASPALARPQTQWVTLGEQKVGFLDEGDVIPVGSGEGPFLALKLRATGNDVDIRLIRIRFLNGEEQTIRIDEKIRQNRESRAFDLQGERRGIREVLVRYNGRDLFGGSARLAVLGEKVIGPPPGPVAGRPEVIDRQVVDNGADRIEFQVSPRDGRLSRIAIRAVDGPLTFRNVRVTFGNGETQNFNVIERLEPGQESAMMDLEGDRRFVQSISIEKRPSWRQGSTRVELIAERRAAPPPPPAAGGYDVIDQQTVDKRSDRVVFRVPRGEGPFTKIKFHALDDSILFRRIQIIFTNGETQDMDVIERLQAGEESPDIDIERGDRRNISEVIVTKRPSWSAGQSRLALLGVEAPRRPPAPPPRPSGPPAHGYPPGWVLIGAGPIQRGFQDRGPGSAPGLVTLQVGRDVGQFSSIGLRLIGDYIKITAVNVVYGNGERERIGANINLLSNQRTQPLRLRGDRFIRSIEVSYFAGMAGKTYLEVYGDYADGWLGDRGRRRDFNQGWVLLGAQRALMFSNDVDAFHVGERYGRFKALRVAARDHEVKFYGIRVIYGNGEVEEVPFFAELSNGQSTRPIDLRGPSRFIDRIEIKYRTRLNFKGEGIVEIWGLQ